MMTFRDAAITAKRPTMTASQRLQPTKAGKHYCHRRVEHDVFAGNVNIFSHNLWNFFCNRFAAGPIPMAKRTIQAHKCRGKLRGISGKTRWHGSHHIIIRMFHQKPAPWQGETRSNPDFFGGKIGLDGLALPIRNEAVENGERDRPGRVQSASRRLVPATKMDSPFSDSSPGVDAFGETPKAAVGTTALPNPSAWLRLRSFNTVSHGNQTARQYWARAPAAGVFVMTSGDAVKLFVETEFHLARLVDVCRT